MKRPILVYIVALLAIIAVAVAFSSRRPKGFVNPQIKDFEGLKVGVVYGTSHEKNAKEGLAKSKIEVYDTQQELFKDLSKGEVDGAVADLSDFCDIRTHYPGVSSLPLGWRRQEIAFLFPKTEKGRSLSLEFNAFLDEIRQDGTLCKLTNLWESGQGKLKYSLEKFQGAKGRLKFGHVVSGTEEGDESASNIKMLDLELAALYCQRRDLALEVKEVPFASLEEEVREGLVDLAGGHLSISAERAAFGSFSKPYTFDRAVLYYRSADKPKKGAESWLGVALREFKASFDRTFVRDNRYQLILNGICVTVALTLLSTSFGLILGLLICLAMMKGPAWLVSLAGSYIRIFQGTPMVVVLMVFYYVIFGSSGIPAFAVAAVAFAINFSAYVAEAFQSAVKAVDKGQWEAALALGYGPKKTFWRFVLPQAMLHFLPVLGNLSVGLLKDTSIVGYVAVQDLTKMGDIIRSRTYEAFFPLVAVALIYFALFLLISAALSLLQKRLANSKGERRISGVRLPMGK